MQETLAKLLDDSLSVEELIALTLETGKVGVDGMALLDTANTETYGNPEITKVNIGVGKNPGILVSGHDLKDIRAIINSNRRNRGRCLYSLRNVTSSLLSKFKEIQAFSR